MIDKATISEIFETARIDEVVGDFVSLRKRGVNMLGLCPFHNEKTPSFTVSPAKGIYKCFGCGKGGNAVNFIMEHEHYTYPEALKYLADKYSIEIEEEEQSPEEIARLNAQESLFHVSNYAAQYFKDILFNTDAGKAIGLSYLKERGYREETIDRFQVGYALDEWEALTTKAQEEGYKLEFLEKTGLTIVRDDGKKFDRFKGRVIFPIHNLSGRVIGFGGRIMKSDTKMAKYINSPESDIYNKSRVLYGLYFSRNAILAKDNCFLVEGYTDVMSLHQAGIENVVASSGTALTVEQIKLIHRFTQNITILYDGDEAGLKASFRGIDLILEQGMNVSIVLFPDGEDPDSYVRKHRTKEVEDFISGTARNFIAFKTDLLLKEAKDDPVKKASVIKEIVTSIALIPDGIYRNEYIKEVGRLMRVPEQTLMNELNRELRKAYAKKTRTAPQDLPPPQPVMKPERKLEVDLNDTEFQEKEIIRLLVTYGTEELSFRQKDENNEEVDIPLTLAEFVIADIQKDDLQFGNAAYQMIYNEYVESLDKEFIPDEQYFLHHPNLDISQLTINLIASPNELSPNWERNKIYVKTENDYLQKLITTALLSFKEKQIKKMINRLLKEIQEAPTDEDRIILQKQYMKLKSVADHINKQLSRPITSN